MERKLLGIAASFLVILALIASVTNMDRSVGDTEGLKTPMLHQKIVILHTNDSHGAIDANMGMAAVSALKLQFEQEGAAVLLLDAGDTLHGLPIATADQGATVVNVMNQAGYDAMCPGNHDFNYGTDRLLKLESGMNFPLLCANITNRSDGAPVFPESVIIEKGGVLFGIFGICTPETAYKTNPQNVETLTFADPITQTQKQVEALQEQGVDYIIGLMHVGIDESSSVTSKEIARQTSGVDLIIDGHSHSELDGGLYLNGTIIVSAGEALSKIGVVTMEPDGTIYAQLISQEEFNQKDPGILALIEKAKKEQEPLLNEVLGKTPVFLQGERNFVRTEETNLSDLSADALADATDADFVLLNGGGIRASLEIGEITRGDLMKVFPFGNYGITLQVDGQQILDAIEIGLGSYPEPQGSFPVIAGGTVIFDPSAPEGHRIVELMIQGEEVDPSKEYLLATNDFIAAGGDYPVFQGSKIVNEWNALEEIVIEYIQNTELADYQTPDGRLMRK